jgi:hypothetical protein
MPSVPQTAPASKARLWAGRIISALVVLFLLFDGIMKLIKIDPVLQAFTRLGYPASLPSNRDPPARLHGRLCDST